jgi:hypothetical protein
MRGKCALRLNQPDKLSIGRESEYTLARGQMPSKGWAIAGNSVLGRKLP